MTPSGPSEPPPRPPRPELGDDPAQYRMNFAHFLGELRVGADLTLDALVAKPELKSLKSRATVGSYLTGNTFPRDWVWVEAFVAVCLSRYQLDARQLKIEQTIWKEAWRQAQRQQKTRSPEAPKPAELEPLEEESRQNEDAAASVTETKEASPPHDTEGAGSTNLSFLQILFRYALPAGAAIGMVGGILAFFFGDVNLTFSYTNPDQSTMKSPPSATVAEAPLPPLPVPPASSTAPPSSEGTITLYPGDTLDIDASSSSSEEAGTDILLTKTSDLEASASAYLSLLPDPVPLERRRCENLVYGGLGWSRQIQWYPPVVHFPSVPPAGSYLCVYTDKKQFAMLVVEEVIGLDTFKRAVRVHFYLWRN